MYTQYFCLALTKYITIQKFLLVNNFIIKIEFDSLKELKELENLKPIKHNLSWELDKDKTRMTTFIKTKFKISDDQTNIDNYRLAANITEYHLISKLILQRIIITNFCGPVSHLRYSIGFGIPIEFPSQRRRKNSQIGP